MHRCRALALALAFAFAVAPTGFADHDKDKKEKDTSKSQPAKQSPPPQQHAAPAQHSAPPQQTQQHSAPQQHSGSQPTVQSAVQSGTQQKTENHRAPQPTAWGGKSPSSNGSTSPQGSKPVWNKETGHTPVRSGDTLARKESPQHSPIKTEAWHHHPNTVEYHHAYDRNAHERTLYHHVAPPVHLTHVYRPQLTRIVIVPTTYHYRRTVFYDAYAWEPPVYTYGFYPRYGLWDATFLMFALDHMAEEQYALMFYHHQNDPDFQQWLADANRLAGENDELRTKLDTMQTQIAQFKESGVEADSLYIPPDAQDVALSPEVIAQFTGGK